ncbi:natterin-3-like [Mugil cephalus]|uniref:natterin-3-like n=1 Tax=Mugil cephalus TaxID=48193 RepID=UPI001FB793D2|nr:natterin-3-like [Mugil cephalus]
MMLSLLLVLALTTGSLQDTVKKPSQDLNVSSLNYDLEERVNTSVLTHHHLSPDKPKLKRQANPFTSTIDDQGKLKWLIWSGFLPNGSVSIYNYYVKRWDYVCKFQCEAGFYSPSVDSYCHYAYGGKEYRKQSFEILVNEDNFEILEWKDGSYDSIPQHPVKTCSGDELFVGKNKYGLGKVHRKHQAFFLPWKGEEYWYKSYKVLTMNKDVENEHISEIKYNSDAAEVIKYPPETMHTSTIVNYECNTVTKTITLSKQSQEERMWHISSSIMVSMKKTFTGGIPNVVSSQIEVSGAITMQFSGGHTYTETSSHSVSVEIIVPPNHTCKTRMLGYRYKSIIPFNARLTRTYRNGEVKWTSISGTFNGVQTGQVMAVVDRCQPLTSTMPCPIKTA